MKFYCPETKTQISTGSTKTSFRRQILPSLDCVIVRSIHVYSIHVTPKQLQMSPENKVIQTHPSPKLCKLWPSLLVFLQNSIAEHTIYLSQKTANRAGKALEASDVPASSAGRCYASDQSSYLVIIKYSVVENLQRSVYFYLIKKMFYMCVRVAYVVDHVTGSVKVRGPPCRISSLLSPPYRFQGLNSGHEVWASKCLHLLSHPSGPLPHFYAWIIT